MPGIEFAHRQIVVTVQALQRTAARHFDRNLQRNPLPGLTGMQVCAELAVG
jgi:hypothetical protein